MSIPEFYRQFAPTSTAETFEERKRRKEQEELVEMQSTISVPKTTIEEPRTQESNIPEFYRQFSPTPKETIIKEKQESTIPEFYRQFKQKEPTDSTTLPAPVKYDRTYSLDDLDNDEYFQKRAKRFLESIGTDEDIYETLRDSDWSITDALARAYDSGKWTEQQKADYKYLRNTFDKAEVGGLGHILEATKDIAIDIVADPLNLIAGLFIVGSGGVGVAGATAVSRIAASQALKTGAKKLANQKGFRAVSMGLTEGAYDAGLINVGTQLTEIQTGVRQAGTEFSMKEAGLAAGLGATAGATLVGGAHKLANYMLRKEHDKLVKTYDLDDELIDEAGEISAEAVSQFKSNVKWAHKITSQTVGKPLTEFIEDAKNSPIMKQLLLNFRHDTFRRIFSARSEKIDVANMTFSRDADKTSNTYAVFVKKALQKLEYGKEGDTFLKRFFNPNLKLTEENDLAVWSLLARGDTLDKYMTVTPVDINKPLHSVNTKTLQPIHSPAQASGIPKRNRLSKEEFQFLRQYNANQLEAAAKIRYFLKQAHKEASNIDAVDPKTGLLIKEAPVYAGGKIVQIPLISIKETNPERYARIKKQQKSENPFSTNKQIDETQIEKVVPFSLFETGQQLDNYLPRKYIGKVMKEKEDIFVPALAKTSHALPKSQPKIEEKILVESVQKHIGTAGRERKYIPDPSTGEKVKVYKNELTEDQEYFFNLKTKNLPHIKERVARGENIDDIDAEFLFKRYDSFEDMAIADINRTLKGDLDLDKLNANQWNKITEMASEYKAQALFDDFLQKETTPIYRKTLNDFYAENKIGKTEFLNPRIWNELDDKFLIDNGFIQTDAAAILEDYAWKLGHKINEEKYFGYGNNYVFRYLEPIREELIEKGYDPVKAKELTEKLLQARDYATGGRYANTDLSDLQKGLYDGIKVSQILAHLPLATLSSITEPLIALGRSDLVDTPAFVKEFSKGIGKSTKKSAQRFYNHMQAARGKEVKGFKDLSDEDWLDAYRAGVATEQAMMTKIEGMFAEGMQTGKAKNIINAFFNINFLQQWTQGVQLGAFNYAKERSIRILGELAEDKNVYGIQLTRNSRNRRAEQLREIGIEPKQGVAAYRRAVDKDGVFNKESFKEDSFYDTEFTSAAALFSKEIILNPSAAELNKPMWFNQPGTGILVQFAGYPTAFNNTVLKGFARDVIRHPMSNAPKVIAASGMMAGTATIMNWLRSGGESLKNRKDSEIIIQSFERPGLLGWLQYPLRYYEGTQYGAGFIGSGLKSVSGPFVGDVVDGIAYRQPWFLVAGANLPGYGALSPQAKRDFKDMLRRIFDKKESDPRFRRAKGGEVIGVPNVKEEPDELKMRGLPYSYSELAGHLFQDEEERGAFAEGGKASITETDEMYSYLTKDEDTYNIQLNKNPINIYAEEELPDLEVKETYFTGFKGNTVSDRLNSVRQSTTIGLPVTTDKAKARGVVRTAGKIKFNNVLKLNIDTATPDAVQAEINKNMDSIIKIEDKVLAKEIIKATNDNLALRDDVLNKDPDRTPEKEAVIAKNKSFLVRHQLLKLSYDAIETNEGYTLLRENQFLPTEIIERGFKGGGLASTLNRRQQYGVGGIASKLAQRLLKKQTAKKIETPFEKVTPENYKSLFGGSHVDANYLAYPKYAAFKGKKIDIVDMTPDEYIKESAKLFRRTTPKSLEKGRIENIEGYGGQELIDKIKNSMKQIMEGKKVKLGNDEYDSFAPVALYANKQQEGLHRAIAAKQLGIKKIPVIVEKNIKKVDQGIGYNYFKEADRVEYNKNDLGYYSKVPAGSSSDDLTRSFLKDFGIDDLRLDGYNKPPKGSTENFFIDKGNNKYVLFIYDGRKHRQKTLNNPTVEELRNYFGYSKGGLVSTLNRRQEMFLGGLIDRVKGLLGALKRRAIGTYNRTQTKIEDIQKQAALIGGPGQAVSRSLITKGKEVLPELFKNKLIQSESSGNYQATKVAPKNQNLYVGAYQFGDARLKDYRRDTKEQFTMDEFKESRELQDKVFDWHINDIRKGIKRNKLDQYIGQRIKNIPITEPGMVAAAHLGGFTGMKQFITLLGEPYYDEEYWKKHQKLKPSDADDGVTYLSDYLDKFKDTRFEREEYNQGGETLTFNQQYHLETIKQKRAMRNSEGQTVTVRAEGFEKDGIVYNLPTYDRRGGIIANPLEFFKEDIKSGRIQGYAADKETYSQDKNNMHLHPANIAANKEHKMMEKEVPEEVIMYEEK